MKPLVYSLLVVLVLAFALPGLADGQWLIVGGPVVGAQKYDANTGSLLGSYPSMSFRTGSTARDGKVYTPYGDGVGIWDVGTGGLIASYVANMAGSLGVAVGSNGFIYASDTYRNRVVKIDAATGVAQTLPIQNYFSDPRGMAVGPDGDLYVCNYIGEGWGRAVSRYNVSTGALIESYLSPGSPTSPEQLIFSPSGDLYMLSQCGGSIYRLNRSTRGFEVAVAPVVTGDYYTSMAFAADGTMFMSNCHLQYPGDVRSILRRDGQTGAVTTFISNASGPLLVVDAVPEPSASLCLLGWAGIAAVGAIKRRR